MWYHWQDSLFQTTHLKIFLSSYKLLDLLYEKIEKEISEQNKLQASIRTETGELKKEANTLKGKAATALLSLQEAKSEERTLSAQVVQSPKRIKREMEQALKEINANFAEEEKLVVEFIDPCSLTFIYQPPDVVVNGSLKKMINIITMLLNFSVPPNNLQILKQGTEF